LLVFQLITLPVEFDASRRAKIILREMGIVQPGTEAAGVNNVLNAAALTYVAAFIAALGNLLWLMSLRDRRCVAKMDPVLAFPARRISDLLSSGLDARAKSRREAMDQPRTDPDQELVKRTQAGDASAFDDLVIKYTPRLYGLVYNMTSNHEDTNDLLQDIFAKAYKAIRGFRGKSSFYTWIHSIA